MRAPRSEAFNESQQNSELVRSFIDDLADSGKANFALIALDTHVHRSDPPDANELRELNALARATIRSTVPTIKVAMAQGRNRDSLLSEYAKASYAFTMLTKNDSPASAKDMLAEVRADLPSSATFSPSSGSQPPQKAHITPNAAQQAFNSTLQHDLGATATVYVQYTTWEADPAHTATLRSRAETVANAISADRQYVVPEDVDLVPMKLTKTSVRYYYDEDRTRAIDLSNIVAKQLGTAIAEPHYNGPDNRLSAPDVPRGHLEVWMAARS